MEGIKTFASDVKQGLSDFKSSVASGFQNVKSWLSDLGENIGGFFTSLGEKVGGFFSDLGEKLATHFKDLFSNLKDIFDTIVGIPKKIVELFSDLLKLLFIPEDGFFDSQVAEVRQKFAFADSIIGTAENIFGAMSGNSSVSVVSADSDGGGGGHGFGDDNSGSSGGSFDSAPVFYFDFSSTNTSWNYGSNVVAVSMNWFDPWRDTVQNIIRAFVWVTFIINSYKDLPAIISGTASYAKSSSQVGGDDDS
mgnify:CR=1 FL=1